VSGRTVRGPITDGPLLRVQYWRFGGCFRTVRRSFADSPPRPRRRSARSLQTVRPGLADGPPGACGQSAWSNAELLSLSPLSFSFTSGSFGVAPRVGRSAVTTLPWQPRVGILGCEFGAQAEFSLWRRIFIGSHSLPPSLVA
jgi:hypothetical protein